MFLNALMFASFCCGILAGQFKLVMFFFEVGDGFFSTYLLLLLTFLVFVRFVCLIILIVVHSVVWILRFFHLIVLNLNVTYSFCMFIVNR